MERTPYAPMQPSSEGPNPLRPYYRPPSIGVPTDGISYSSSPNTTSNRIVPASSSSFSLNIDYNEVLGMDGSGPTTLQSLRALTDQLMWKYTSAFLAQPFEVAKMVLQARVGEAASERDRITASRRRYGSNEGISQKQTYRQHRDPRSYEDASDSEEDETSYFTSTAPVMTQNPRPFSPESQGSGSSRGRSIRSRRRISHSPEQIDDGPHYRLDLRKPDSLMEVIGQLWQREGAWGIWKGTNVTFVQNMLLKSMEAWVRGVLCAMMNVPDAGVVVSAGGAGALDILDSPSPLMSLSIAVATAGICGLVLAPLDAVRTRIMLTPTSSSPRSIIPCLRALPSFFISPSLILPTLLHSALPTFISTSTPLFLRSNLHIDPIISPRSYSICTFASSVVELFIKLPIETVLRRGQIQFISQSLTKVKHSRRQPQSEHFDTVVEVGPYTGIISTMWRITREEGSSTTTSRIPATNRAPRRGQGTPGLIRGWKLGMWALVGLWSTTTLGAGSAMGGGRAAGSEF